MKIAKIIIGILILTFLVIFFVENTDPVEIYFPILKGRKVGLMFIMLVSCLFGAVATLGVLATVGSGIRKKRKSQEKSEGETELFDEE
jgi:uncharacterized integral membrane protein